MAVFVGYFAYHSALDEFYDWAFYRNLKYAAIARNGLQLHLWALRESADQISMRLAVPAAWPFTIGLVSLPFALVLRRSWRDVMPTLWCITSVAAMAMGLSFQTHYAIFLQLALALAFASVFDWVIEPLHRVPHSPLAAALSPLILCGLIFNQQVGQIYATASANAMGRERGLESLAAFSVAQRIRSEASAADRILGFGDRADVVFYTGLKPGSKYIYWPNDSLRPDAEEFMREVREARPAFVYLHHATGGPMSDDAPGVRGFLSRFLSEGYDFWFEGGGGRVYRQRERQ